MNSICFTLRPLRAAAMACGFGLISSQANAQATYTFLEGSPFDGGAIGASVSSLDTIENVIVLLETVDIIGQNGSRASDLFNLHLTNILSSSNALGINDLENPGGYSNENRDFNPGEGWVFKFDTDVRLLEIDLSGQNEDEVMTISSSVFADLVLGDDQEGDVHDLQDTLVPAGTEITIQMSAPLGTGTGVRISNLVVQSVPPVTTGADLLWAGANEAEWNFDDFNFTDAGVPAQFFTDDNVTIQSPGVINVLAGGVVAGEVLDENSGGTVTLQSGALTVTSLEKTGGGNLVLAPDFALDTDAGATLISGGVFAISDEALLESEVISISGGATLQVDSGGTIINEGSNALGEGGGVFEFNEAVTLGAIGNAFEGTTPLTKSGSGVLTLTGYLGVQTTAPVELQILEGSVVATGEVNQLNVAGLNVFDGDLVLDGARVSFHGSTVSGTGVIEALTSPATIISRFNGGTVEVENQIILTSDLRVDAPSGDSQLFLNGVMSGAADLIKGGNGIVTLRGNNTYSGSTTVESGTLALDTASLDDASTVTISPGGVLSLSHGVADTVEALILNGEPASPGSYGGSSSGATIVDNTHFDPSSTGYLIVTTGPISNDYDAWSGPGGYDLAEGVDGDDDQDGVSNGDEYAFGLDPTDRGSLSPVRAPDQPQGSFTYTRRNPTAFSTGLTYSYGYSTTLEGEFTPFVSPLEAGDEGVPVETVRVTISEDLLLNSKLFIQVKAQ